MNAPAIRRNPWPYAIAGYFILFAGAMAAWIAYAVHQKMDLVQGDYYEEEIRYQHQIDRQKRTQPLRGEVNASYDALQRLIVIKLPLTHALQQSTGLVRLYRPSDARLDHTLPLSLDTAGTQTIDAKQLRGGLWKVRIQWAADGQEYFFDQALVIKDT